MKPQTVDWTNPEFRFQELLSLYDYELNEYIEDINDYDPRLARKYMVDFFVSKGKGDEIRDILSKMGK